MLRRLLASTTIEVFNKVLRQMGKYKRSRFHQKPSIIGTKVDARKMQRTWMNLNNNNKGFSANNRQQKQNAPIYKLMSYNILSQDLLVEHSKLYTDLNLENLYWEQRLARLRNEICSVQPDILCLQEMQYNHLEELMHSIRQHRNLAYVYKKKTNFRSDGCAIIYDNDKFNLLAQQPVEFFASEAQTGQTGQLNRGNVAIMAKFSVRSQPEKQFIIATTHLLFNPKRENIRVAQVQMLLQELKNFSDNTVPIVLTGDFNSERNAAAYDCLITDNSCLSMLPVDFGPNAVSTYQDRWLLVDHIVHTQPAPSYKHNISICGVLLLPTRQQCNVRHRTPNQYLGSDHFSLIMSFSLF